MKNTYKFLTHEELAKQIIKRDELIIALNKTLNDTSEAYLELQDGLADKIELAEIQLLLDTAEGFESELLPEFEKGGRAAINALRAMAEHKRVALTNRSDDKNKKETR